MNNRIQFGQLICTARSYYLRGRSIKSDERMLATEPSVSIFGEPLTTTQLAKLAAEAGHKETLLRSWTKVNLG